MSESESDNESVMMEEDDENRVDDEEFPISEDEDDENEDEDSEDSEEEDEDNSSDSEANDGKTAWANSISKILNAKNTGVLSKAQKIDDIERNKEKKKQISFEVVNAEAQKIKEEKKPGPKELSKAALKRERREKRENKLRVFSLRLKPQFTDLDRERTFKKIATRGVVQLFNAVKSQQVEIGMKLENTKLGSQRQEIIRSSDNKNKFLDKLMSGPRSKSTTVDSFIKKEEEESSDEEMASKSTWSALRNDFMTGKKVGWDKDSDEDNEEINYESEESD